MVTVGYCRLHTFYTSFIPYIHNFLSKVNNFLAFSMHRIKHRPRQFYCTSSQLIYTTDYFILISHLIGTSRGSCSKSTSQRYFCSIDEGAKILLLGAANSLWTSNYYYPFWLIRCGFVVFCFLFNGKNGPCSSSELPFQIVQLTKNFE